VPAAPATLSTDRLTLRRPDRHDAQSILAYAGDPEVTRYMSWPTHGGIEDTYGFLEFAEREWNETGVGPYVITSGGSVIGSTGLQRLSPHRVATGYILRRDAWGKGYATEACRAMVELGRALGFFRIEAICHIDHRPSARVLEKAGMTFEGVLRGYTVFPNLDSDPRDVRSYAWTQPAPQGA